jgi:hypothetical protein
MSRLGRGGGLPASLLRRLLLSLLQGLWLVLDPGPPVCHAAAGLPVYHRFTALSVTDSRRSP